MAHPPAHRNRIGEYPCPGLDGCWAVCVEPISKLPSIVRSPGPYRPIGFHGQRMIPPGGKADDIAHAAYPQRKDTVGRPVAHLSGLIVAPRPDASV